MKKLFTLDDGKEIEITGISYSYCGGEIQAGLLLHDVDDVYHDGDCVYGKCVTMPETAEDAETIMQNEYGETCFDISCGGIYIIGN